MQNTICPRLLVETIGGVTVIGFADPVIVSEEAILEIVEHLGALAEGPDPAELLLNFRNVDMISGRMFAVLFWIARRIARGEGSTKLCCIAPHLLHQFEITRLRRYFEIYSEESLALASFARHKSKLCPL
jgi:anti-anti-sigma factor